MSFTLTIEILRFFSNTMDNARRLLITPSRKMLSNKDGPVSFKGMPKVELVSLRENIRKGSQYQDSTNLYTETTNPVIDSVTAP